MKKQYSNKLDGKRNVRFGLAYRIAPEKCPKCIDELSGIASAEKHDMGTKIATCVEATKTAVKCVSVAQA